MENVINWFTQNWGTVVAIITALVTFIQEVRRILERRRL